MRRGAWSLLALAACAAGCAQVLDLDAYGPARPDGGDDGTQAAEGGADAAVDQLGADQTVDSPAADGASPFDAGLDGTLAGDAASGGDSDAGTEGGDALGGQDGPPAEDAGDSSSDMGDSGCGPGAACAPPAPPGWTGPVVLWEGTGGAPGCAGGSAPAFSGGAKPPMQGAQCTCTCGPPTGAACGPVVLTFAKNCRNGGSCGTASVAQGSCTPLSAFDTGCGTANPAVTAGGSTASGGGCTPNASTSLPPWTWGSLALACEPSAGSGVACGTGVQGQCIAVPSQFEGHACVLQQGAVSCPGGGYSVSHLYYTTANDSRTCSSCTCGSPTGVNCNANAQVEVWSTAGCNGGTPQPLSPIPSGCVAPGFMQGATFRTTPTGGSCAPAGGQPAGTITPEGATTICCTP